jgi:hypothetical protein
MIVYRYGALKPTSGFELLLEHLKLAARYRNQLVELLNWRIIAEQLGIDRDRLRELQNDTTRFLRARSGLGFGTYQAVEADVQRAAKARYTPPRKGSGRARWFARARELGLDPTRFRARFRKFDGTGRIGAMVQACSELRTDKVLDGSSNPLALFVGEKNRGVASVRVGKYMEERIELPVVIHRTLPTDAQVVRALIRVERSGTRWIYSLHVTLKMSRPEREFGTGSCAINFGWRSLPEGVRVAYALDEDGSVDELVLPRCLVDKVRHRESLRSLADDAAVAFLGDAKLRSRERRRILKDPTSTNRELGQIRIEGEPLSPEHWARRDRHLYQWESDEGTRFLNQRREIYRLWVRGLAKKYGSVTVEQFNLTALISRDRPVEIPEARHIRFLVAPGYLRQEVKSVFGPDRCELLEIKKRTTICAECGGECEFGRARELLHNCEHCGAQWDQDANNSMNQLSDVAAE